MTPIIRTCLGVSLSLCVSSAAMAAANKPSPMNPQCPAFYATPYVTEFKAKPSASDRKVTKNHLDKSFKAVGQTYTEYDFGDLGRIFELDPILEIDARDASRFSKLVKGFKDKPVKNGFTGFTSWRVNYKYPADAMVLDEDGVSWRFDMNEFNIYTGFLVSLPGWLAKKATSKDMKGWRRYRCDLEFHEAGHVNISREKLFEGLKHTGELRATSKQDLKRKVSSLWSGVFLEIKSRQKAYDKLTKHGRNQTHPPLD